MWAKWLEIQVSLDLRRPLDGLVVKPRETYKYKMMRSLISHPSATTHKEDSSEIGHKHLKRSEEEKETSIWLFYVIVWADSNRGASQVFEGTF